MSIETVATTRSGDTALQFPGPKDRAVELETLGLHPDPTAMARSPLYLWVPGRVGLDTQCLGARSGWWCVKEARREEPGRPHTSFLQRETGKVVLKILLCRRLCGQLAASIVCI